MPISVIHEDKDFLVLDKPAGIAVHGGARMKEKTLVDWLTQKYPEVKSVGDNPKERPGIVHRLDKDTSGVMIAARTQKAFEALKQLFKERKVEKTYLALVAGIPAKKCGVISASIGRSASQPTKRAAGVQARGSRTAVTTYRLLEKFVGYSLLEVKPKTGRPHQIRAHLAFIGHPVAGDRTYGGGRAIVPGLNRQFLHAWKLEFSYPEGRRLRLEVKLPQDLDRVLKKFRMLRHKR